MCYINASRYNGYKLVCLVASSENIFFWREYVCPALTKKCQYYTISLQILKTSEGKLSHTCEDDNFLQESR